MTSTSHRVRLSSSGNQTRIRLVPTKTVTTNISPPGRGPDPWMEPIQTITAQGNVVIDYSLGRHCVLNVVGQVTNLSVTNWPPAGRIARLTLELTNTGPYDVTTWDYSIVWPEGAEPILTTGAGVVDRIILSTADGGVTVFGDVVGYDYK